MIKTILPAFYILIWQRYNQKVSYSNYMSKRLFFVSVQINWHKKANFYFDYKVFFYWNMAQRFAPCIFCCVLWREIEVIAFLQQPQKQVLLKKNTKIAGGFLLMPPSIK